MFDMKRLAIKSQMFVFGRCYCASPHNEYQTMDSLDDLGDLSFPVPWRSMALRAAKRRERKTGGAWHLTKWSRE